MKYNAFISYSSKDELPKTICARIESMGANCWIAPRNIPAGTPYARAIMNGLEESENFLVFISSNSLLSEDVLNEIDNAHGLKKTIIPIFIENVPLNKEFSYYLKRKQWVNCFDDIEGCILDLCKTLNISPKSSTTNTPSVAQCQTKNSNRISLPPFDINYFFNRVSNPKEKTATDSFIFPIEDVFSITGRGTVVTGRIESGSVYVGDKILLEGFNRSRTATVIGIERSRKLYDSAEAGEECGILLRYVDKSEIERGMVLTEESCLFKEFTAAIYLLTPEECSPKSNSKYYNFELISNPTFEFYNRTCLTTASIVAMSCKSLINGNLISVRLRVPKAIFLKYEDRFALRYNGSTVGCGLIYEF